MTLFEGARWPDDEYNIWLDDEYNTWLDSDVTVRASSQSYAGAQYWDQFVISLTPPQFRLDHLSGGYCKLGFGDMTLTLDTFQAASIWPPPESCPIVISYADSVGTITQLFVGTMHRQSLSRDGIVYQLYERTFDKMLLTEAVDYDGNTVPLPRAFGAITHQQPVRLPDASGHRVYHHGYLTGTKGVDWHVYDDGVNVDSNVTAATSSTFEYTVTPVGELTVSGTGSQSTLVEIFNWASGAGYLNLSFDSTLATAFTASIWANSQEVLVSFLDRIAAGASHLFFIVNETLYLVDMDSDNGTMVLTEFDYYPASITFARPVALIKTSWTDRTAVEETIGKYIKEIPQEVVVAGAHPYGNEESADCFQSTKTAVTASLTRIHGYMTATRWETSIPIGATFPQPGIKITALDESMGQDITITIHARDIEYDFENQEIKIAGEGTIA
jgi:hypothetical protein